MGKASFIFFTLFFLAGQTIAQPKQTIRGKVVDKSTLQELPGANAILLKGDSMLQGTTTDLEGKFQFNPIPPGRYDVRFQFVGFVSKTLRAVELTSAKELILTIELDEAIMQGEEVVIQAERPDYLSTNEFASVSARSFSVEETQRYAGSINDPGRMAMSLPGVQMGQQDNENTMVIKANSPIGTSWRLEGVEIPNPNHFADRASSGGGISALSIYVLGQSDFFTSAFPAEYGNAFGGVIDMHFKKGNRENREWRIQAGMIGLDVATEGPFSKKKKGASYVANYRYSTLGILSAMGFQVVAPNVSNTFQDLSFNLSFPLNEKSELTVFGLGGLSSEQKTIEEDPAERKEFQDTRAYDYKTNVGVLGLTHKVRMSERSNLYTVFSLAANEISWLEDTLGRDLNEYQVKDEYFLYTKLTLSSEWNRRWSGSIRSRIGIQLANENHEVYSKVGDPDQNFQYYRIKGKNQPWLIQPYVSFNQKVGARLTLNYGLHLTHLQSADLLEGSDEIDFSATALEPRLGLNYAFHPSHQLGLGLGLHSRVIPYTAYYSTFIPISPSNLQPVQGFVNEELGMIRAAHATLSYDFFPAQTLHFRLEPYVQYLFNIPVAVDDSSSYSLINQDDDFYTRAMENEGTAWNYGLEMTLEKYFSGQVFFILVGSFYQSTYEKSFLGVQERFPTRFDSRFNTSLTGGKEWRLTKSRSMELGGRVLFGGGFRFTPINQAASKATRSQVEIQSGAFSEQNPNYFRMDLRVAFRKNREKYSWRLSLDVQNVTNRENPKRPVFDPWQNTIIFDLQSGLIPVLSYILDF